MSSNVILIHRDWPADVKRVCALPHYVKYTRNRQRLYESLLAERAVVEYLLQLSDDAVSWLAGERRPWRPQGHERPMLADISWRGHLLDVKLLGGNPEWVHVKVGAQHFHHVVTRWLTPCRSLRVLGVLLHNQPETFEPPVPLKQERTGKPYGVLRSDGVTSPVYGWNVPIGRLKPLSSLLNLPETKRENIA